jgi:hypothetical protein
MSFLLAKECGMGGGGERGLEGRTASEALIVIVTLDVYPSDEVNNRKFLRANKLFCGIDAGD